MQLPTVRFQLRHQRFQGFLERTILDCLVGFFDRSREFEHHPHGLFSIAGQTESAKGKWLPERVIRALKLAIRLFAFDEECVAVGRSGILGSVGSRNRPCECRPGLAVDIARRAVGVMDADCAVVEGIDDKGHRV